MANKLPDLLTICKLNVYPLHILEEGPSGIQETKMNYHTYGFSPVVPCGATRLLNNP